MNKKQALAAGGAAAVSLFMAIPAFAATDATVTSPPTSAHSSHRGHHVGIPEQVADTSGIHSIHGISGAQRQKLTNATFGTVASVNGTSFTLAKKTRSGTSMVTVGTDRTTTFKKNGQADTLTDLTVGQRVVAMGTKDSSGNIADATSVNIMVRSAAPTATTTAS